MHTDDHILEALVAAKGPLPAVAAELKMSFIALIRWMDAHADLIAAARRGLKRHIKMLSLRAEAAALVDLTSVSSTTTHEERKRKSASQLLRHASKRLLTKPTRKRARSVCDGSSARSVLELAGSGPRAASAPYPPNAEWRMPNAASYPNAQSRMPNAVLSPNAASSPASCLRAACGSAPALHPPDIVTQAVVAGLHMGMRIPGFTLADCAPP